MPKYLVTVKYEQDDYYYSDDMWKDQVCVDFDENVVIVDYAENASWWKDAKEILQDIDNSNDLEDFVDYYSDEYAKDKLEDIYNLYYDWDGRDKPEFMKQVVELLYPGLDLTVDSIRGYSQGDHADVLYLTGSVDVDILGEWFYGDIYDVRLYEISDEDFAEYLAAGNDEDDLEELLYIGEDVNGTVITYSELSDVQRDYGNDERGFIQLFGLPENSDITILYED